VVAPKPGAELALAPNIAAAEDPPKEKLPVPAGHPQNKVFSLSHLANLPCHDHASARLLTSHFAVELNALCHLT